MSKFDTLFSELEIIYEDVNDQDFHIYVGQIVKTLQACNFFEDDNIKDETGKIIEERDTDYWANKYEQAANDGRSSIVIPSAFNSTLTLKVVIKKSVEGDNGFHSVAVIDMSPDTAPDEPQKKEFKADTVFDDSLLRDLSAYVNQKYDSYDLDQKVKQSSETESPVDELPSDEESALPQEGEEGEESEEPPQELEEPPQEELDEEPPKSRK